MDLSVTLALIVWSLIPGLWLYFIVYAYLSCLISGNEDNADDAGMFFRAIMLSVGFIGLLIVFWPTFILSFVWPFLFHAIYLLFYKAKKVKRNKKKKETKDSILAEANRRVEELCELTDDIEIQGYLKGIVSEFLPLLFRCKEETNKALDYLLVIYNNAVNRESKKVSSLSEVSGDGLRIWIGTERYEKYKSYYELGKKIEKEIEDCMLHLNSMGSDMLVAKLGNKDNSFIKKHIQQIQDRILDIAQAEKELNSQLDSSYELEELEEFEQKVSVN